MAYTPQQGLFVNGRIADANEVLNEFTAISVALKENSDKTDAVSAQNLEASKQYTDGKFAALNIDGGTF